MRVHVHVHAHAHACEVHMRTVRAHCTSTAYMCMCMCIHLQVVLWHTRERRKLSRDESPSKAELCRFLQAHAHYTLTQAHHVHAKCTPRPAQPHTTTVCMHLRAPPCTCAHLRAGQPLGSGLRGTRQAGHRPLRGRGGHAAVRAVCGRGRCGRPSMVKRPPLGGDPT